MNDFNVTPIVENGVGAEVEPTLSVDEAMEIAEKAATSPSPILNAALKTLRQEVNFRWEQRTALSFRLQDLRQELVRAGIDDMSPLYESFHSLTSTAEGWMHPGTLSEAAGAHLASLKARIAELEGKVNNQSAMLAGYHHLLLQPEQEILAWPARALSFRITCPRIGDGLMVPLVVEALREFARMDQDSHGSTRDLVLYAGEQKETRVTVQRLPDELDREAAQEASGPRVATAKLPEIVYDSIRVQRHMKSGGYNVDVSTVSKVLDAVVKIADIDAIALQGAADQAARA